MITKSTYKIEHQSNVRIFVWNYDNLKINKILNDEFEKEKKDPKSIQSKDKKKMVDFFLKK
jgi:hypothetical protein